MEHSYEKNIKITFFVEHQQEKVYNIKPRFVSRHDHYEQCTRM
jgi:hypothetical protein